MKAAFLFICVAVLAVSPCAYSSGYPDGSDMSTPDMAKCAAAALKTDIDLWKQWHDALHARYAQMYKTQTQEQINQYTIERVIDKRRALGREGVNSKPAFKNYFEKNCAGEI